MTQLPHDTYIEAVVDALTAAGLEPTEWWTSDTEINRYDGDGLTTQLEATFVWDGDHPAVDNEDCEDGIALVWEHPAEQWLYADRQSNGELTMAPEFLPGLPRWADPKAVATAVWALVVGRPAPTEPAALWDGHAAAQAAVSEWEAS